MGGSGSDTLMGGAGNDVISDTSRSDNEAYRFAQGDGHDTVFDKGGIDRLEFGEGITRTNIVVLRSDDPSLPPNNKMGSDLIITLHTGDTIRLSEVFVVGSDEVRSSNIIENVYFHGDSYIGFYDLLSLNSESVVDIIAPDQPSAIFNDFGTLISGVAEVGSTVIVTDLGGDELGSVGADPITGAYSIELMAALINKEAVNVTATDIAGNQSPANQIIAPDLTAPAAPVAQLDETGAIIHGLAEAGASIIVRDAADQIIGSTIADAITGSYSMTFANAFINSEMLKLTATDAAGNASAVSTIYALDKTPPAMPLVNLDIESKTLSGVAEPGSSVVAVDSFGVQLGTVQASVDSGSYTIAVNSELTNGQSIFVTATDSAGNVSAAAEIPVVIDVPLVGNGLRGSYYGYHQSANGNVNLTNLTQIRTIINSRSADASFVATRLQYSSSNPLGMNTNLQNFLRSDAASLSRDPTNTSDAIIRFDGKIQLAAGSYKFRVRADDGYSIKINGAVVAEYNANQSPTTRTHASFAIPESGLHEIEIVYWDSGWGNMLNVELADAATGIFTYVDESILFQPLPEPALVNRLLMDNLTYSDDKPMHYSATNAALIQAMASFAPQEGFMVHKNLLVDVNPVALAAAS